MAEPRWSPDGTRLGWLETVGGRTDLLVAGLPGTSDPAPVVVTPVTGAAGTRATGGGVWCWVGTEHVAVVDPLGRLVLLPVAGGPSRVLSADGRAGAPAAPPGGQRVAFVVDRPDACDVAVVELGAASDPPAPRIVSARDYAWDPAWSPDGQHLVWHEWDLAAMSWDASWIVLAAGDGSGARVIAGGDDVSVGQPRFSPDGQHLAWVSDESGWWNVMVADAAGDGARAALPEPAEHAEPAWGLGQRSYAWSPTSDAIALCRNEAGFGRLVVVDLPGEVDRPGAVVGDSRRARELGKGWHHGLDWGPAGIAAVRSGARTPPTVVLVEPDARDAAASRRVVAHSAPAGIATAEPVEPEPVTWTADDGATVYGLLYRPDARAQSSPPPLLVDVHGGPTGQATASWRPTHQHFVTRGWAVLAPDPRGSTGHGRAYTQAINGWWGARDVTDCASGIRAAIDRGWGAPERVAIMGGSAGALTALLVAAHHPDLVRAVIAMYPVTDALDLARTTHRFESRSFDRLIGPLPEAADRYRERSPLHHAAAIRRPTLVLHGDADEVVPLAQAQALVEAIRAAGGTVELHVYEGQGHGWRGEETVLDVLTRTEDFLTRWCGP